MEFNKNEINLLTTALNNYIEMIIRLDNSFADKHTMFGYEIDNYKKLIKKIEASGNSTDMRRKENDAIILYNNNWYSGKAILIPDKGLHDSDVLQILVLNDAIRLNIPVYVRAKSVKTRLINLMNNQYGESEKHNELIVCESDKGHGGEILLHPYAKPYDIQKIKERGYKIANGFVSSDDIL